MIANLESSVKVNKVIRKHITPIVEARAEFFKIARDFFSGEIKRALDAYYKEWGASEVVGKFCK